MMSGFKYSNMLLEKVNISEKVENCLVTEFSFNIGSVDKNKRTVVSLNSSDDNYEEKNDQFITRLLKRKKNQLSLDSNLLPPAIKYSFPGLAVFERPPSYQMVQYIPASVWDITEKHEPTVFRIAIPWQLYIIFYDPINFYCTSVKMFFMQNSLNSTDQRLFLPPMPNFFTNGMLCRPMFPDMDDVNGYSKDLAGVIASAYDWIWNSGFNHDLSESVAQFRMQRTPKEIISDKAVQESSGYVGSSNRNINQTYLVKALNAWEKIDIKDILNIIWPNPSLSQNFEGDVQYYQEYDSDRFDISCETGECSEDDCGCFPELRNEIQTFDNVIKATLDLDYNQSNIHSNASSLPKSFLAIYEDLDLAKYISNEVVV
ncbi:MAG: hypothetical protein O3A39_04695 [Proteobacteria bacterium]|nr:hypothetical protein [Pseudomonadota bacterium]